MDERDASLLRRQDKAYSANKLQQCHVKHLCRELATNRPGRALEVGCGEGFFTQITSEYAGHVTAVDLSNKLAPMVNSRPNVTFYEADGTRLPFESGSFDFVYSIDVIEHVERDDLFVTENIRVLAPNGTLVIVTPNRDRLANSVPALIGRRPAYPLNLGHDPILGDIIHIREYTKKQLLDLLRPHRTALKSRHVEGYFLGVSGGLGWCNSPSVLERLCKYWKLTAIKSPQPAGSE